MPPTVATQLTLSRLLIVWPILGLLYWGDRATMGWAWALFWVAMVTDVLDGYVARRWNQVTDSGAFLDALADKVLMYFLLFSFFAMGVLSAWWVFPMFFRDALVDGLRSYSASKGRPLHANWWGKIKFSLQFVALNFCFLSQLAGRDACDATAWAANVALALALGFSLPGCVVLGRAARGDAQAE